MAGTGGMSWLFLISGLFLGWSLGANDAANVFGTAVGTRMVRFSVAAGVASAFVILGAFFSGGGTTDTLVALGGVDAMAGAFTVALAAAATISLMSWRRLPVSTSQAIVGAILGWNLFTGRPTDATVLAKVVWSWVTSPVLAGLFAAALMYLVQRYQLRSRLHLLRADALTRLGLITVGAFGAYSLGANNIANVMGVFVSATPLREVTIHGDLTISSAQQLFLLGGVSIAVGIYTQSRRVMATVGNDLFSLTPVAALVVVLASSMVLFIFSSEQIGDLFRLVHLPPPPLVPVSGSQAVVGAIIGIALMRGGRGLNFRVMRGIASGWVSTPLIAAALCFVMLFVVQNVFEQRVVQ